MKHLSKLAIGGTLLDARLFRTYVWLMLTMFVAALAVITLGCTLLVGLFKGLDWRPAAELWFWPAFRWVPAVPTVLIFAAAFWGYEDENFKRGVVDIVLATCGIVATALLIQRLSVWLNGQLPGLVATSPLPDFGWPWVVLPLVLGFGLGRLFKVDALTVPVPEGSRK